MKKTILGSLICSLLIAMLFPFASAQAGGISASVSIKGSQITFPAQTKPYVSGSTVMIPAQFTLKKLGASVAVSKNSSKKSVISTSFSGKKVQLTEGSKAIKVNGKSKSVSVAPTIKGSTLFIPVNVMQLGFGLPLKISKPSASRYVVEIAPKAVSTPAKITDDMVFRYLRSQVPEIASFERYLAANSDSVSLIMYIEWYPKDPESEGYYHVYTGENHATHTVVWNRFRIGKNLNVIHAYDSINGDFYSLAEWRNNRN